MIIDYIKSNKPKLDKHIVNILNSKAESLNKINFFGNDSIQRLVNFCTNGKSLRGILVLLGAEMFGAEKNDELFDLAAILEIIHSCILIQDDIQDDDTLRRGKETIWYQFEGSAEEQNFKKPKFYGQSMAIDVFLIGHYIALERLMNLHISCDTIVKLGSLLSSEVQKVGVAQSQDLYHAYVHADKIKIEDIENVALYKTGRYTISLPLMLGAVFAGKNLDSIKDVEKMGELLGIVFQIKDDELAIFGNEEEFGKKVGNDIAENKKTHFRELLFQRVSEDERNVLKTSFGNRNLNEKKVLKIRELIEKYNIRKDIQARMDSIGLEAKTLIAKFSIKDESKNELFSLVDYLLTRTK